MHGPPTVFFHEMEEFERAKKGNEAIWDKIDSLFQVDEFFFVGGVGEVGVNVVSEVGAVVEGVFFQIRIGGGKLGHDLLFVFVFAETDTSW